MRTPGPPGGEVALDDAGLRPEVVLGVLGVDPELDGVAAERDVGLAEAERLAGGDPDLRRPRGRCPVSISVTGCSTWIRQLISMK